MNMKRLFARPQATERMEATTGNVVVCFESDVVRRIRNYELEKVRDDEQAENHKSDELIEAL
ncbi:MAG: hypothetical protein V5B35_01625 [Candidatus Accumulibacter necessarius]|jgi:hypothetical protein|uniref:hypothetical protein n=1 Tax=Candidatus Accumulibacter necessarius TaxID=2954386 RepID=UPI002FC36DFA